MLNQNEYPILEYDDSRTAKLNPAALGYERFDTDKLIITFFPEVKNNLLQKGGISLIRTIPGENPVEVYRFSDDPDVLLTLGRVGCPACAGALDLLHAMGITKVMFCGGGGVLDKKFDVGRILVVEGAIRDEGFSYHYLPPSRIVYTDADITDRVARYLEKNNVPCIRGITWTTDALYRETQARIEARRAEGAKIVEMEQAGCIAVAKFRGFSYGTLIYGGDDLSGAEWSDREWHSREGVRSDMVRMCREIVKEI